MSTIKNCLTCRWAKTERFDCDGRSSEIGCRFPVPEGMPESWRMTNPDISYYQYDGRRRRRPYVGVIHDEYHDEREITDCSGYKRGKNDLKIFRVETSDTEEGGKR